MNFNGTSGAIRNMTLDKIYDCPETEAPTGTPSDTPSMNPSARPTASPSSVSIGDMSILVEDVYKVIGGDIIVSVNMSPADLDSITLSGFPAGTILTYGDESQTINRPGKKVTILGVDLASLTMTPAPNTAGVFNVTAVATTTSGQTIEGTVPFEIQAVADPPVANTPADPILVSTESVTIDGTVNVTRSEDDDSEYMCVIIIVSANEDGEAIGSNDFTTVDGVTVQTDTLDDGGVVYEPKVDPSTANVDSEAALNAALNGMVFTPLVGESGTYEISVLAVSKENLVDGESYAPNDDEEAGTPGDIDTTIEENTSSFTVILAPISISDYPSMVPSDLPSSSPTKGVTNEPTQSPTSALIITMTAFPTLSTVGTPTDSPVSIQNIESTPTLLPTASPVQNIIDASSIIGNILSSIFSFLASIFSLGFIFDSSSSSCDSSSGKGGKGGKSGRSLLFFGSDDCGKSGSSGKSGKSGSRRTAIRHHRHRRSRRTAEAAP